MVMLEDAVPESMWGNRDRIINRPPEVPPWLWMVIKVSDLDAYPELKAQLVAGRNRVEP